MEGKTFALLLTKLIGEHGFGSAPRVHSTDQPTAVLGATLPPAREIKRG